MDAIINYIGDGCQPGLATDEDMKAKQILAIRRMAGRLTGGDRSGVLHALLRRTFRHAQAVVEVEDFDGSLAIRLDLSEHMQRRIFWKGYYNDRLVPVLDRLLQPGDTVIDVGANIGEVSMLCARRVGVGGRVHAFEPVDVIADELEANLRRNQLKQVTPHRLGLGAEEGSFDIYASYGHDSSDVNMGVGSLHGDPAVDRRLQTVKVRRLDALTAQLQLTRLDFLKLDIEGAELACLEGSRDVLERFRPVVVVEVQAKASNAAGYDGQTLLSFLADMGYEFHLLRERGVLTPLDPANLGEFQDVVCVHQSAPDDVRARLRPAG